MNQDSRRDRTSTRGRCRKAEAFTLIELLVVIAVLAILAALLLPALSRARAAADSAVCKSNLHQWSIGLRLYLDTFSVYPTDSLQLAWPDSDGRHWYARLEPYAGGKWPSWDGSRYVPDARQTVAACPGYGRIPGAYMWLVGSYGYNGCGLCTTNCSSGPACGLIGGDCQPGSLTATLASNPLIRDSQVRVPSDMIAIGDAALNYVGDSIVPPGTPPVTGPGGELWYGDASLSPVYNLSSVQMWGVIGIPPFNSDPGCLMAGAGVRKRHGGRWNVLFCDGHVENQRTAQLFDARRDDVLKRWNRDNLPHREGVPNWH